MSDFHYSSTTARVPQQNVTISARPLDQDEPFGVHMLTVQWDTADNLTLIIHPDQLDQLEHELERARWHRVFRQRVLTDLANLKPGETFSTEPGVQLPASVPVTDEDAPLDMNL